MKKVSVEKWNKEREEERQLIDAIHDSLNLDEYKHLNQDEQFGLSQARLLISSVQTNWLRRTNLNRENHFRSLQDDLPLKPGDEGVGQC